MNTHLHTLMQLALGAVAALAVCPGFAQSPGERVDTYLRGFVVKFDYGTGESFENPRVELTVRYCRSGSYEIAGQSCSPKLTATGEDCIPLEDRGQWQAMEQDGQVYLQSQSVSGAPGIVPVFLSDEGALYDADGNLFRRLGLASC